ncbi:hypothetical protein J8273_0802 [Carpediemonas membranifera]|uniref:Uncharacterized protein n=1 Tax=Carpediemonas membranifera TaxID=201153 RepID=A0A8J6E6Z4_9EUKA|nr:hypothetical protein J8273_0802 [Carpediemonas membranifera]|eukprot:KAG9397672.1 hypothetical protein J8273_0802 [Carpediemonas membranifera]
MVLAAVADAINSVNVQTTQSYIKLLNSTFKFVVNLSVVLISLHRLVVYGMSFLDRNRQSNDANKRPADAIEMLPDQGSIQKQSRMLTQAVVVQLVKPTPRRMLTYSDNIESSSQTDEIRTLDGWTSEEDNLF